MTDTTSGPPDQYGGWWQNYYAPASAGAPQLPASFDLIPVDYEPRWPPAPSSPASLAELVPPNRAAPADADFYRAASEALSRILQSVSAAQASPRAAPLAQPQPQWPSTVTAADRNESSQPYPVPLQASGSQDGGWWQNYYAPASAGAPQLPTSFDLVPVDYEPPWPPTPSWPSSVSELVPSNQGAPADANFYRAASEALSRILQPGSATQPSSWHAPRSQPEAKWPPSVRAADRNDSSRRLTVPPQASNDDQADAFQPSLPPTWRPAPPPAGDPFAWPPQALSPGTEAARAATHYPAGASSAGLGAVPDSIGASGYAGTLPPFPGANFGDPSGPADFSPVTDNPAGASGEPSPQLSALQTYAAQFQAQAAAERARQEEQNYRYATPTGHPIPFPDPIEVLANTGVNALAGILDAAKFPADAWRAGYEGHPLSDDEIFRRSWNAALTLGGGGLATAPLRESGVGVFGGRLTGQNHHAISRMVHNELERHPNLQGFYLYRDPRFMTQALNRVAHIGYQKWNRDLDTEIASYILKTKRLTPKRFERYLRQRYAEPDLISRFPNGI